MSDRLPLAARVKVNLFAIYLNASHSHSPPRSPSHDRALSITRQRDTDTREWSCSFNVTRTGSINYLRLYKSDREQSRELRAYIYDWSSHAALASVVVGTQECKASGWIRVELREPVSLSPNRTYVAAIERLSHYRKNQGYFKAYKRSGDLIPIGSVYGLDEKKMPNKRDKEGDCYWIDGKSCI